MVYRENDTPPSNKAKNDHDLWVVSYMSLTK